MTAATRPPDARPPGIVLDLDGTIWEDRRALPGAAECVRWLRTNAYPLIYLSNNPIRPAALAVRLTDMGLPTAAEEVITACVILKDYLREIAPGARLYAVGDPRIRDQFEPEFTFDDDPARIEVVIAAPPTLLDYASLTIAFRALRRGARFVATNADASFVAEDHHEKPHTAAVIGALEASARRRVEMVAGKPSALAAEHVCRRLGRATTDVVVVGDNLDTDVAFARANGMRSVLVLTGVARPEDLTSAAFAPDHVLPSIADLPALLADGWPS